MTLTRKSRSAVYAAIALGALLIALILVHGCATRPPSAFEQRMFTIQTNVEPIVVVRTNIIPVTIVQTNLALVTNTLGVLEFKTNVVPVFVYQTNVVVSTNLQESYVYSPGAGSKRVQEVGGAVGNIFGVGGLVSTGLGALFGIWGYLRSKKSLVTAGNIAQTVETMREFVKSLPNGQIYDSELVNWMQTNQANAGVLQDVMRLLQSQVSNPDARVAAQQVIATIDALRNLPNQTTAGKV